MGERIFLIPQLFFFDSMIRNTGLLLKIHCVTCVGEWHPARWIFGLCCKWPQYCKNCWNPTIQPGRVCVLDCFSFCNFSLKLQDKFVDFFQSRNLNNKLPNKTIKHTDFRLQLLCIFYMIWWLDCRLSSYRDDIIDCMCNLIDTDTRHWYWINVNRNSRSGWSIKSE